MEIQRHAAQHNAIQDKSKEYDAPENKVRGNTMFYNIGQFDAKRHKTNADQGTTLKYSAI